MSKAQFEAVCASVGPSIASGSDNAAKLRAYGLYKQATAGDVPSSAKPSAFAFVEKAKYEAWQACAGMSQEQAMAKYVEEFGSGVAASASGASAAASKAKGAYAHVKKTPMLPPGTSCTAAACV